MTDLQPLWDDFEYKTHQISGIDWMIKRESSDHSGGLLCDEMGLGKTIEILGLLKNTDKSETLLLCPKAVIPQWTHFGLKSGFNVATPNKDEWILEHDERKGQHTLYITNYEKVDSRGHLFNIHWDRVVMDEAHRVINRSSTKWQAIRRMEKDTLWIVTATPIVNNLKDIQNLLILLGYDQAKLTSYSYLKQVIACCCLHRSMEEMRHILEDLPNAPVITKELLDFVTEEEAEFYRGIQGKIMRKWKSLERDQVTEMFVLLMRLRQLSLHPQVYVSARKREYRGYDRKDWFEPSTKFMALLQKLEDTETPTKWIVFCQFHDEMDLLQAFLEDSPCVGRVLQYHGGMTDYDKESTIENTHDEIDGHDVLLVQLHSGGVGLNLQHFSKVIFMSPWWTAALMNQAIGRAVRIGQTETVEVTHFVLKEEETLNIDQWMLAKAEAKGELLSRLLLHASRGEFVPEDDAAERAEAEAEEAQRAAEEAWEAQQRAADEDWATRQNYIEVLRERMGLSVNTNTPHRGSATEENDFEVIPSPNEDPLPLTEEAC